MNYLITLPAWRKSWKFLQQRFALIFFTYSKVAAGGLRQGVQYTLNTWTHWNFFLDSRTRLFWENCTGKPNIFRVQPLIWHHPDSVCLLKWVTEHTRETAEQSSVQRQFSLPALWSWLCENDSLFDATVAFHGWQYKAKYMHNSLLTVRQYRVFN